MNKKKITPYCYFTVHFPPETRPFFIAIAMYVWSISGYYYNNGNIVNAPC